MYPEVWIALHFKKKVQGLPDMVEKLGAAQQQVLEHWRQTQEELSAKQEEHEQELKQLTDKGQQMQALQAANNDLSRKLKLAQQEVAMTETLLFL